MSNAGCIYYSGGATLAVNNIFKSCDTAPLNKYEYVSLPKVRMQSYDRCFLVGKSLPFF